MHKVVGIPYAGTTLLWAIVLGVVSWQWNRSEGTLSIHSDTTRRREGYNLPCASRPTSTTRAAPYEGRPLSSPPHERRRSGAPRDVPSPMGHG